MNRDWRRYNSIQHFNRRSTTYSALLSSDRRESRFRSLCVESLEARWLLSCVRYIGEPVCDYGDAPSAYDPSQLRTSVHRATGPTLGQLRDSETALQASTMADGDDAGLDDEEGIRSGFETRPGGADFMILSSNGIFILPHMEQLVPRPIISQRALTDSPRYMLTEEGTTGQRLQISRENRDANALSVVIRFDGTAKAGADYRAEGVVDFDGETGRVIIPPGEFAATITIFGLPDMIDEGTEVVEINVVPMPEYDVSPARSPAFDILDNFVLYDYGNAPGHATLLAFDGARHLPTGPQLGPRRDAESDGTITSYDMELPVDNDGVTFSDLHVGQDRAWVEVDVRNAPNGAYLDAWIDFDGDRLWVNVGEHITDNLFVTEGRHRIRLSVPANAASGLKTARFRLSTMGDLGIRGAASDGEVEDYWVTMLPTRGGTGTFEPAKALYEFADGVVNVTPADFDRDGDSDLVVLLSNRDAVWLENSGQGEFTQQHWIGNRAGSYWQRAIVADVNFDQLFDIIISGEGTRGQWFEQQAGGAFVRRTVPDLTYASFVHAVDADEDGNLNLMVSGDFASAARRELRLYDFRSSESYSISLTPVGLAPDPGVSYDVDQDGVVDLFANASQGLNLMRGLVVTLPYQLSSPSASMAACYDYGALDVDNNGVVEVFASCDQDSNSEPVFAWFEYNPEQKTVQQHVIKPRAPVRSYLRGLTGGDLDGDGDGDFVYTLQDEGNSNSRLGVLMQSSPDVYLERSIDPGITNPDVVPAITDLDGDGDLDAIVFSSRHGQINWLENIDNFVNVSTVQQAVFEGAGDLLQFVVERTGQATDTLTVTFELTGTAISGADFRVAHPANFDNKRGTVTLLPGESVARVVLEVINDDIGEPFEFLTIRLIDNDQIVLGPRSEFTGFIADDEPSDFGDAPIATDGLEDGARHMAVGPQLGPLRDVDPNGVPSAGADSDDLGGVTDDDDGVAFSLLRVGRTHATLTVDVRNAPQGARVDAWIDFNRNGMFGEFWWEHIVSNAAVVEGEQTLTFAIPEFLLAGEVYARVRLSTAGRLLPMGWASDGEVEDYRVTLHPPLPTQGPFLPTANLGTICCGLGVDTIDVDKDGRLDLTMSSHSGQLSYVYWAQQSETGTFALSRLRNNFDFDNEIFCSTRQVFVDFDQDGDNDLFCVIQGELLLRENIGDERFTYKFEVGPGYTYNRFTAGDFDRDGFVDLVSARPNELMWHRNIRNESFVTTRIAVTAARGILPSLLTFDVNQDDKLDIVLSDYANGEVDWFENTEGTTFIQHSIIPRLGSNVFVEVTPGDFDSDGDVDLMAKTIHPAGTIQPADAIQWYENDGRGVFVMHPIQSYDRLERAATQVVDLDGDGDLDAIVAVGSPGRILSLTNNGDGEFVITTLIPDEGAVGMAAGDFDGNGTIDLAVNSSTTGLVIYSHSQFPLGDLTHDGLLSADDVMAIEQAARQSSTDVEYDLNRDGHVDASDVTYWVTDLYVTRPGDANLDRRVDAIDWDIWERHRFSMVSSWTQADFNVDGMVDGSDAHLWLINRYETPAATITSVVRRIPRAPLDGSPQLGRSLSGTNHHAEPSAELSPTLRNDLPLPSDRPTRHHARATPARRREEQVDAYFRNL